MNHDEALSHIFEKVLRQAVERMQQEFASDPVTDIFVYPNTGEGEISVLNDDHVCLAKESVREWAAGDDSEEVNEEAELEVAETILKKIVSKMAQEGVFEQLNLQKPFSVVMVDDDMESISELLFIDDDSVSIDENLIKEVDKELGDFFKKLMSDF